MTKLSGLGLSALLATAACSGHGEGVHGPRQTLSNDPDRSQYRAFFTRVARLVKTQWGPDDSFRQADPDGSKYGRSARAVVLEVTLASDGSIAGVRVAERSGVDFLDSAAEGAVRAASPIDSPPSGVFDASGLVRFHLRFIYDPAVPARSDVVPQEAHAISQEPR